MQHGKWDREDGTKYEIGGFPFGYVIGIRPVYTPFLQFLRKQWKGVFQGNGFFICKFSMEEDLNRVLEKGIWMMKGHPIVLRRWSKEIRLENDRLETIPLWITFPNLPPRMWTRSVLSKLASLVGTPICMDSQTAHRKRIDFAKVMVEVSASELSSR